MWRDIPDYEGLYQASEDGRVRSLISSKKRPNGCVLVATPVYGGYLSVQLYKGMKRRRITIHRLVAAAFLGWPEKGVEVNHIDGNKLNNAIANLEYCSRKENAEHAWRKNLTPHPPKSGPGELNPRATLTEAGAREVISSLASGERIVDIARRLGVGEDAVAMIKRGRTWTHLTQTG